PEWEVELNIGGGIGVMRKFIVVVETVIFFTEAKRIMPFQAYLFPVLIPGKLLSRTYEVLPLHLLDLANLEDELARDDLISEGFPGLGYSEGDLHSPRLLDIGKIDKDTLSGFRSQVQIGG